MTTTIPTIPTKHAYSTTYIKHVLSNYHGATPITRAKSPRLPAFLNKKIGGQDEYLHEVTSERNGKIVVIGKPPNKEAIFLQSNDYLNISKHMDIAHAQIQSLNNEQRDNVMSATFLCEKSDQGKFERAMADFSSMPGAVLCQSGWAANVSLMQVISDESIPVYIDMFAHMSLWEGIKQSGAKAYTYKHNDAQHLERLIQRYGAGVVITESIFSTTGVIAPLADIIDICNNYHCLSVVDESHSLGTHGPKGAGLVAELGLSNKVHFITASLAKAFAGRAGIILGSKKICDRIPFLAYSSIFSSALLPCEIAGLSATLNLIINSDERRKMLQYNARYLAENLSLLGYNIESHSQIIALEAGSTQQTDQLKIVLENKNVHGSLFCAPATPKNRSLMRLSVHSGLTQEQMDTVLNTCADIRDEVGMWQWKSVLRKQRRKH